MSRRPSAIVSSEGAGQRTSAEIVRLQLLDAERDRPKWIDRYIDYFGDGGKSGSTAAGRTSASRSWTCAGR